MFDEESDDALDPEAVLNRVGDPEPFIKDLRDAHRDRELRRRIFIDSLSPEVKAEWIDGEAVYHSPAREAHNWTSTGLTTLLTNYGMYVQPLEVRIEKAMVEAEHNNFEPDICIWQRDGPFEMERVVYPAPDIAVEILSKRTRKRDLGEKKRDYAKAGTHEYWVIDADARTLRQFENREGTFEEVRTVGEGDELHSSYLGKLRFPMAAIWSLASRKDVSKAWMLADGAGR